MREGGCETAVTAVLRNGECCFGYFCSWDRGNPHPRPPTCPLSPLYVHQGLKLYIRINSLTSSRLALPPVPVPLRLYMSTASLTALNAYISSGLASSSPTAVRHQRAVGLVIWSFYLNATLKILVLLLLSHMSFNLKMLRLNETLFPPRNTVIPILL